MLQRYWTWIKDAVQSALVARRPQLPEPHSAPKKYHPLERVEISRDVVQTLFDDFDRHRQTARGDEEFGWAILGLRDERSAQILAALPAGAQRSASLTHIQFHSEAQAVATRLLRQTDKRLTLLGVVHTHPGSLRHPSSGDYRGDIRFVTRLRGRQGIFAIGTADDAASPEIAQPDTHRMTRGPLNFCWYSLAENDETYRRQAIAITEGDDLAAPLAGAWPILETHADAIERLCQLLANAQLACHAEKDKAAISISVPLPNCKGHLRVLLEAGRPLYYVEIEDGTASVDPAAANVEHGVLSILAELAKRKSLEV